MNEDLRDDLVKIFGAARPEDREIKKMERWVIGELAMRTEGEIGSGIEVRLERVNKKGFLSSRGSLKRLVIKGFNEETFQEMSFLLEDEELANLLNTQHGLAIEVAGGLDWAQNNRGREITETGCRSRVTYPKTVREMLTGMIPWLGMVRNMAEKMDLNEDTEGMGKPRSRNRI